MTQFSQSLPHSFRSASEFQTLISQSKNPLPPLAQFLHSLLVGVRGPSFFRSLSFSQLALCLCLHCWVSVSLFCDLHGAFSWDFPFFMPVCCLMKCRWRIVSICVVYLMGFEKCAILLLLLLPLPLILANLRWVLFVCLVSLSMLGDCVVIVLLTS